MLVYLFPLPTTPCRHYPHAHISQTCPLYKARMSNLLKVLYSLDSNSPFAQMRGRKSCHNFALHPSA